MATVITRWYVDVNRAKVTWASAVTAGAATQPIYRVERTVVDAGAPSVRVSLWALTGATVPAAELTKAQGEQSAEAVPALTVVAAPVASPPAVRSTTVTRIEKVTQAQYDQLGSAANDPTTYYVVVG